MTYRLALWAALAGGLIPLMAVINARLGKSLGDALFAPMVLFLLALSLSVGLALVLSSSRLDWNALSQAQPIDFAGGLIVCFYVVSATLLAPRMGVGNFILFAVVAQIVVATCIDHFGLLGAAVRELSTVRAIGIGLLISGLFVTQWSAQN